MATDKKKKSVKVRDLKPKKDTKGGGRQAAHNLGAHNVHNLGAHNVGATRQAN
jgi:hypothetical protein